MTEKTEIKNPEVCQYHHQILKDVKELNNRVDYMSTINFKVNGNETIHISKAIELILFDLQDIKKNTSLVSDSVKLYSLLSNYTKKHKGFMIFVILVFTFLISKNFFLTLIDKFFNWLI
jgi:hypothetical protein